MPGTLDAIIAAGNLVSPFLGTVPGVGAALPLALKILAAYRDARNKMAAAGGESGLLSDAELIDLLQKDSDALVKHADDLIAKWSATPPSNG